MPVINLINAVFALSIPVKASHVVCVFRCVFVLIPLSMFSVCLDFWQLAANWKNIRSFRRAIPQDPSLWVSLACLQVHHTHNRSHACTLSHRGFEAAFSSYSNWSRQENGFMMMGVITVEKRASSASNTI